MTLTVDDRELIEALRAEAVSVVLCNEAADRFQSLLSDRDKLELRVRELTAGLRDALDMVVDAARDGGYSVTEFKQLVALRSTDNG